MEVIKLGMITIPIHKTLYEYYELKQKYEVKIQTQRQKKKKIDRRCPLCKNQAGLIFYAKNKFLYSVCQTPTCSNNIIIPINTYTTYESEYEASKQRYDASVQQILRNKFDILFSYKQAKDVNIEPLRNQYLSTKEYMKLLEQSYQFIIESPEKQEKRIEAYQIRDHLIDTLKMGNTLVLIKQLHEVLKTIHDIDYSKIEINRQVDNIHMEYSLQNLELKRTATSVEPAIIPESGEITGNTITFTFGDCVENGHIRGPKGPLKHGLELDELSHAYHQCAQRGLSPHLIDLRELLPLEDRKIDPAYLLLCEGWVDTALSKSLMDEHVNLEWDKVKNTVHNLCYAGFTQIESGKRRVYSWDEVPVLKSIRDSLPRYFGELTEELPAEGNKYNRTSEEIKGTGFHGDTERVIAIALRIGDTRNIQYQWYKNNKPVGSRGTMDLPNGTMYAMSHKALGNDTKKTSILTLRHASGDKKFLKMDEVTDTIYFDQLPNIYATLNEAQVRKMAVEVFSTMAKEDLLVITPKQLRQKIETAKNIDLTDWKEIIKEEASAFIAENSK